MIIKKNSKRMLIGSVVIGFLFVLLSFGINVFGIIESQIDKNINEKKG